MAFDLTEQQKNIIGYDKNTIVLARPGSGKTTTISLKASKIMEKLKEHQGIIAISFTNKASNELKTKILEYTENIKNSFFGTIDKFTLLEIIFPFGKQMFCFLPNKEFETIKLADVNVTDKKVLDGCIYEKKIDEIGLNIIKKYYRDGKIIMELNGLLALYILDNSIACQRYLKTRYTHVFIDEYQDCDYYQNEIFKRLVAYDLIGVAVGDPEQSIFQFAVKDSKYLVDLGSDYKFKQFPLDINHRSHQSIIDYSLKFINKNYEIDYSQEKRVSLLEIDGDEVQIAKELDSVYIDLVKEKYGIDSYNKIAILVSNNKTSEIIAKNIVNHKIKNIINTSLDESISIVDSVFKEILTYVLDDKYMFYDFKNNINLYENDFMIKSNLQNKLDLIRNDFFIAKKIDMDKIIDVAEIIIGNKINIDQTKKLESVLSNPEMINSFTPIKEDEVVLITIYKAKGMEFDAIFHLNLHEFILPKKTKNNIGQWVYEDLKQCTHLHYVALTRAKKYCYIVSSKFRTRYDGQLAVAKPSEFICRPDLYDYIK